MMKTSISKELISYVILYTFYRWILLKQGIHFLLSYLNFDDSEERERAMMKTNIGEEGEEERQKKGGGVRRTRRGGGGITRNLNKTHLDGRKKNNPRAENTSFITRLNPADCMVTLNEKTTCTIFIFSHHHSHHQYHYLPSLSLPS